MCDQMMFAPDGAFFTEVFEGDGDITDTEEACTLRCEAAYIRLAGRDRADRGAVPIGGIVLDGDTPAERHVAGTEATTPWVEEMITGVSL